MENSTRQIHYPLVHHYEIVHPDAMSSKDLWPDLLTQLANWVSDIESLTSTDTDLTNSSIPTAASRLLKTLEMCWDLHQTWRYEMMFIQCKDSCHAYQKESPERPPPRQRKSNETLLESQRQQRALVQIQKHIKPCAKDHDLIYFFIRPHSGHFNHC